MRDAKKYVPCNQYFKTGKGGAIDQKVTVPDYMFTTKKFKFSSQPKKSYIDSIYAEGKKKQIGPVSYKNLNPRK